MYSDQDLNLNFLLGKPISIPKVGYLYSPTIDEITNAGFDLYNKYLSILCISSEDICELYDIQDENINIEPYEYLLLTFQSNEENLNIVLEGLKYFFREEISYCIDGYFFVGNISECRIINKDNFNFIIDILKRQNCISRKKENTQKPKSESQKKFFALLMEKRKKYKTESNTDISDTVSAICAKHPSVNLFNVGKLTIYQLVDTYKRLNSIDEYFISIQSLLAGAKKEDVNLVHWGSKLNKD
jgi:hypothetical protein